jgi:quinol monooxygenase YgiN
LVTKWKSSAPASADSEYLLLLTYLPLKRFRAIPRFLKYTFQVERQLRQSAGLIGYSLEAELLRKKFWTLSAWQDEKALMTFVRRKPHDEIMKQLAADMARTRFTRWTEKGSQIPPSWSDAKARMRQ